MTIYFYRLWNLKIFKILSFSLFLLLLKILLPIMCFFSLTYKINYIYAKTWVARIGIWIIISPKDISDIIFVSIWNLLSHFFFFFSFCFYVLLEVVVICLRMFPSPIWTCFFLSLSLIILWRHLSGTRCHDMVTKA